MNPMNRNCRRKSISCCMKWAICRKKSANARESGDTDEYTRLFRVFLPVQKQYLKLCAELEKLTGADVDELAAFNGA